MKRLITLLIFSIVVLHFSCITPQLDDAPDIGTEPTADFTINDSNPNNLTLTGLSDTGFLYNWDLGNGQTKIGKTVNAYYPFPGTFTISCIISGKGGTNTTSKTITITSVDPDIYNKPVYKELTNHGTGRTWEYDDANDSGYCFMTANYDWEEFWWNPYEDDPTPDYGAKIKFDLLNGRNCTFIAADGTETPGNFILDIDNMTIEILDTHIPDYDEENCDPEVTATGVYNIKIIDDGHLYLWQDQSAINPDSFDYGWSWVFKSL